MTYKCTFTSSEKSSTYKFCASNWKPYLNITIVVYPFCSPKKRIIYRAFIPGERALAMQRLHILHIFENYFCSILIANEANSERVNSEINRPLCATVLRYRSMRLGCYLYFKDFGRKNIEGHFFCILKFI